jgi:hypothetical protein
VCDRRLLLGSWRAVLDAICFDKKLLHTKQSNAAFSNQILRKFQDFNSMHDENK